MGAGRMGRRRRTRRSRIVRKSRLGRSPRPGSTACTGRWRSRCCKTAWQARAGMAAGESVAAKEGVAAALVPPSAAKVERSGFRNRDSRSRGRTCQIQLPDRHRRNHRPLHGGKHCCTSQRVKGAVEAGAEVPVSTQTHSCACTAIGSRKCSPLAACRCRSPNRPADSRPSGELRRGK